MRLFATVILSVLLLGGALLAQTDGAPEPVLFGRTLITVGDIPLRVQMARAPEQLERGLMYRESLAPYDGMLFEFPYPRAVSFWMKDTQIPLEVGYFDYRGVLVEIYSMKPYDTTEIPSRSRAIRYALELPEGDFEARGLKIGDKIAFPLGEAAAD